MINYEFIDLNIGGEDYHIRFYIYLGDIIIEDVFSHRGYYVEVSEDLENDILDKLKTTLK